MKLYRKSLQNVWRFPLQTNLKAETPLEHKWVSIKEDGVGEDLEMMIDL
jgi:hypothetical protein